MRCFRKCLLVSVMLLCCIPAEVYPGVDGDLRLEGVMYDRLNPEASVALIEGESLHAGDVVQEWTVKVIEPEAVVLLHEDGATEKRLGIEWAPKAPEPEYSESGDYATDGNLTWQERLHLWWQKWNPAALEKRAWELKALLDIAKIYNAAVHYFNERSVLARSLDDLIAANFLQKSFSKEVRGQYRFYLNPPMNGFGVHADPVNPDKGLAYLFVGQDAVIRSDQNRIANGSSEPHEY